MRCCRCCSGYHPASGWRSCCTTCSGFRSTRSPRRSGRPIGTCRQLARRAREKFTATTPRLTDVADAEHQLVTERFITACANGDLEALTAVLDPTVWGVGTDSRLSPPRRLRSTTGPTRWVETCFAIWDTARRWSTVRSVSQCCSPSRTDRLFAVIVLTVRDNLMSQDRGDGRPDGSSPTVGDGRAAPAYSVVVEINSWAASARCRSCTPVRWQSRRHRRPRRRH